METNWKAIREELEDGMAKVIRSVDAATSYVMRLKLLLDEADKMLAEAEGMQSDQT